VAIGLDSNLMLKGLRVNRKIGFFVAFILCLFLPLKLFNWIQFTPHILLSALMASIALISNNLIDFKLIWKIKKSFYVFIFMPFILSIFIEIFWAFLISLVIYLLNYIHFRDCKTGYEITLIKDF